LADFLRGSTVCNEEDSSMDQPFAQDDVLVNSELARRDSRPLDYHAENETLKVLAQTMADAPQTILRKLGEIALRLCRDERLQPAAFHLNTSN
jgi:hypothetical protein